MKTKLFLFGLASLVFLQSCEKDDKHDAKLKRILVCWSLSAQIPARSMEYEYDNQDRISKITTNVHDENGDILRMIQYDCYVYNSKGQLEKIAVYNESYEGFSNWKSYIYTYSDNGLKIREFDTSEKMYSVFNYSDNQLMKVEYYDSIDIDGNTDVLMYYITYEYNNKKELVKEIQYLRDDSEFFVTDYTYENGLNTLIEKYLHGEIWQEVKKTYDSNGYLIYAETTNSGASSLGDYWVEIYEYDDD